ncbi:MAG: S-methyl-5'-thioadenosine phosphorylase, partial [Dehalococcoidia bacterium]|nr:S-methyl-5'-thioadenosine phosphorylase [Dehalococcoidia bacterium]
MTTATIGVIGGSGLYQLDDSTRVVDEIAVDTPFGAPSDTFTIAEIAGKRVAFLPRHGRGHRISPTELPVRANIWAMKHLGVAWIISVSAVGSLQRKYHP